MKKRRRTGIKEASMIVDFQHHFTPHALMPKDLGKLIRNPRWASGLGE